MLLEVKPALSNNRVPIAFPNWGYELVTHPQPAHLDLEHRFLDAGGLAIIGNHAHVPGAVEQSRGGYLAYNPGDWILDKRLRVRSMVARPVLAVELDLEAEQVRRHRFRRLSDGVGEFVGSSAVSAAVRWWSPTETVTYPSKVDDYAGLRRSGGLPHPRRGLPVFLPSDHRIQVQAKAGAVAARNWFARTARRLLRGGR